MADIELRGLAKRYGDVEVIPHLDLRIPDGQVTVLLGPSGCGKSTLLRMIAGLETPSAGEVRIRDRVVNDVPPADRGCALVFQNYALYPHKSVRQNLAFPLRMAGQSKQEQRRRVEEIAATLELLPLLDRYPRQLSGGQRQRVAMGRAMIRNPEVFLYDEPLSNLDLELRVRLRLEIARLQRSLKSTAVYVTHDQTEAMTLADQIVVLRQGRIEQVGPPLALYRAPANLFVAGFIGTPRINLLQVDAMYPEGATTVLAIGATRVRVPRRFDRVPRTLGFRPEQTRLEVGQAGQVEMTLTGCTTVATEHLGDRAYAYLHTDLGEVVVLTREGDEALAGMVVLGVEAAGLLYFDGDETAIT